MKTPVENGTCERHEGMPLSAECLKCGKKICSECRREFGYFCSVECLNASRQSVDRSEIEQRRQDEGSMNKILAFVKIAMALAAFALIFYAAWLVWKNFLDPAGSIAWQMSMPIKSDNFFILSESDKSCLFKSGDEFVSFDPSNGVQTSKKSVPELGRFDILLKKTKDGFFASNGENSIAFFAIDGGLKWEKRFDGMEISKAAAHESGAIALVRRKIDYDTVTEALKLPSPKLVSLDESGKILWEKDSDGFPETLSAGGGIYILSSFTAKGDDMSALLKAGDLKTGKDKWQIALGDSFCPYAEIFDECVIFADGNSLNAVSSDGKSKLWKVPAESFYEDQISRNGDFILIRTDDGILCASIPEKKLLWEKKLDDVENIACDAMRVFAVVTTSSQKEIESMPKGASMPKGFEQLDDDINPLKQNKNASKRLKTVYDSELICYDVKSGTELWKKKKLYGEMALGEGKLAIVREPSRESLMGSSSVVMIHQIDPKSGKELFVRRSNVKIAPPMLILSGKLIGMELEKEADLVTRLSCGGNECITYPGIAAFRLK